MKRLIALVLILMMAAAVSAIDTPRKAYKVIALDDAADSVYARGETLYVNLLDLVYGLRAYFDTIEVITLDADTIKGVTSIGTQADIVFKGANGQPFLSDTTVADSAIASRRQVRELVSDSLEYYLTSTTIVTTMETAIRDSLDGYYDSTKSTLVARQVVKDTIAAHWAAFVADANVAVSDSTAADVDTGGTQIAAALGDRADYVAVRDTAGVMIKDSIYAHAPSTRQIFELVDVASQDHPFGDNCVLTFGRFTKTVDSLSYLYMDSSAAADAQDTAVVSGIMPAGTTQLDSLMIVYQTSSATTTTSKIDAIRVWVTSGFAGACTVEKENLTDSANTAISIYEVMGGTDTDFDAGEKIRLRIIFEGDANAWLKVVNVIGIAR